jgi:hypothetical protein
LLERDRHGFKTAAAAMRPDTGIMLGVGGQAFLKAAP